MLSLIQKMAGTLAQPYLNSPTPESLEFISTKKERETVTVESQLCFVYELLTSSGERYQKRSTSSFSDDVGIPILPTAVRKTKPTLKCRLRETLTGERRPSYEGIDQLLQSALEQSTIVQWTEGLYGIFGSTESEIRRLLYVPATTAEEADTKIEAYRQEVTSILQPKRLQCKLKIKPLLKPGHILHPPTTLKHSYFGGGC
ncbi:hypothetical protein HYU22_01790 [Candidatus Woesearchaeota archaeon]|nr:hypothetical protein [Candidatus Woesearchaeota archaeon]